MDFSKSHFPTATFFDSDTEEDDDDFLGVSRPKISHRSSIGTWNSSFNNHGSSADVCKKRNGRFDQTSLVAKINKIIGENQKSILHAVEIASSSVTQLESRTRRLENSMDDLKICAEFNHGRTSRSLMQLESILKKVHMDVKFLLDKREIAETELQLQKKLQRYRTEPEPLTKNLDAQTTSPHQKQVLDPHTCIQPDLNHGSEIWFSPPHESYYSNLVHHSSFTSAHSRYIPNHQQFEQFEPCEFGRQHEQPILHSFRVSDQSLIPANTTFLPPNPSSYSQNYSYDDFATQSLMKSSEALPNAIPRAAFLDADQPDSGEKRNKTSNEEIVEELIAMGFRREIVRAAVRKLTQKKEPVDLNTLLDKLMK